MFVAENNAQELINLLEVTPLQKQRLSQRPYRCPCCQKEVILKQGRLVRAHFAHKKSSRCQSLFEHETTEHLSAKTLLVEVCQQQGRAYQLEAYLPELQQRPDVLVEKWAFEVQCSALTIQRLQERIRSYQTHGFADIWLLGKQFKLAKKLTALQRTFLRNSPQWGQYLWHLDVETAMIRLSYHIEERLLSKELFYSWQELSLADFFIALEKLLTVNEVNFHQIRRFDVLEHDRFIRKKLQQKLTRRDPEILELQGFLYLRQLNVLQLHPHFFLPVVSRVAFKVLLKSKIILWEELMKRRKIDKKSLARIIEKVGSSDPDLIEELHAWLAVIQTFGFVQETATTFVLITPVKTCLTPAELTIFTEERLTSVAFDSRLPQKYDMIETIRK